MSFPKTCKPPAGCNIIRLLAAQHASLVARMKNTRLVFFLLFAALSALGQTVTGSLAGHVADSTGGALAGVKVAATETTRGRVRQAVTNDTGNYPISSMEPGVYKVTIEHPGFKTFINESVAVAINTTVRVDGALEVGAVNETVQVSANTVELKTDRGDLSLQIDNRQFENL